MLSYNKALTDSYENEKLGPDDEIPQDNRYTISWETDFGKQISELSDNVYTTVSERPQ